MAKRMILTLVVAAFLLTGLGYFKMRQVQAAIKAGSSFTPPPEAVTAITAHEETWPSTLNVVGTMAAVHGVTVSADLPGTVAKIDFESGKYVRKGDVLVELDTREERAQLASIQAQHDLAKANYDRYEQLVKEGVISRADYDKATADQKQWKANVGEIQATIERKTIRAPFSGVLGIRQVNLGQYLAAGSPIVPLQTMDPIYVNFSVPQQVISRMKIGSTVQLGTDGTPPLHFRGHINAVDSIVNESTRNIQVQATVPNPQSKLHPGMFVQVDVGVGTERNVIPLPASAISYAPFGDSVFVITNAKTKDGTTQQVANQQFVKVEGSRGDQVAVISGIKPGDEVITSGAFKLRNGAAILVNNKVQPGNNPAPHPEDN